MPRSQHSMPDPYHAKPQPEASTGTHGNLDGRTKRGLSRFDRIDRQIRHLKWLVAINLVLSAALLVVVMMVLDG